MRKILAIILFICTIPQVLGQLRDGNISTNSTYENFPVETIHLTFNSSLLLSGEYLYYKVNCLNAKTKKLSTLSKVAYVSLIGTDLKPVFTHKIALKKGVGQADFFIPVSVPSGNYKLIAHTNWMRNNTNSTFFESDLVIINPYRTNFSMLSANNEAPSNIEYVINTQNSTDQSSLNLDISLQKSRYKTRSEVELQLILKNLPISVSANVAVSVRKLDPIRNPKLASINDFWNYSKDANLKKISTEAPITFLPELRGQLIEGKVEAINKNLSIENLKVSLSIPGPKPYFAIAQTNNNGKFYFNIDNDNSEELGSLTLISSEKDAFRIRLEALVPLDYSRLKFKNFAIDSTMKEAIIERSIHNQIENAYFEFKPDSIIQPIPYNPYSDYLVTSYKLDDYNRFETLKETIIEIVKDVFIQSTGIRIQGYDFEPKLGIPPLILVDGILMDNLDELLNFNAYNIDEILVWRDQLIIGPSIFQGMIQIKTKQGYALNKKDPSILITSLFKSEPSKRYYAQKYEQNLPDPIPDDRVQLLWAPTIELNSESHSLVFFTSDVKGDFEIIVEGFTSEGLPLHLTKMIRVE